MYWSDYAVWVVSNDTVYFRSSDGALIAFEHTESAPVPTPTPTRTPSPTPTPTKTPTPTPTPTPLPPGTRFFLSVSTDGTLNGFPVAGEDIVMLDPATSLYTMHFDGSDVGLASSALGAFSVLPAGEIIFSTTTSITLPGIAEIVTPQDIVKFVPSSTGELTGGTFSLYLDGSDVELTTANESIDAVFILANGHSLISTTGGAAVSSISAADEDLLEFTPTTIGETTSGSWAWYFDGSDVGLSDSAEDSDAIYVDSSGWLYISTSGNFSLSGVSGQGNDVVVFMPTTLGSTTTGTFKSPVYFDGANFGMTAFNLSGFWLGMVN